MLDETIPEAQASALADLVAASVGIDAERGDLIVMNRVPFNRELVDTAVVSFEESAGTEMILTYARIALPIIVLLVAFFFFRMLMKSLSRRGGYQYASELPMEYAGAGAAALPAGIPPALASGLGGMLPAGVPVGEDQMPDPEEMKSDLERQVTKLAESHPDTVAEVVQSWLRED